MKMKWQPQKLISATTVTNLCLSVKNEQCKLALCLKPAEMTSSWLNWKSNETNFGLPMQIIISLNLLLAYSAIQLRPTDGTPSLQACVMGVGISMLMSLLLIQLLSHVASFDPAKRNRVSEKMPWVQLVVWTLYSLLITFGLNWSHAAKHFFPKLPITGELLIVVPHLTCLLMIWIVSDFLQTSPQSLGTSSFVESLRRLRQSLYSQSAKIQFLVLPVVLPIIAVLITKELLANLSVWEGLPVQTQIIALTLCTMVALAVVFPLVVSRLWSTSKLLDPTLQDELNQLGKQLRLQVSSIQMWNTGYRVANAAVIGWIPGLRKILFTDVVCRIMHPTEMIAIFLHEAGHIKKSHSMWKICVVLLPLMLSVSIVNLKDWLPSPQGPSAPFPDSIAVLLIVLVFVLSAMLLGWLSKLLEFEADCFAVITLSKRSQVDSDSSFSAQSANHESLINALEKTAQVTGCSLNQVTLMHPSILNRTMNIRIWGECPAKAAKDEAHYAKAKSFVLSGFLITLAGFTVSCFLWLYGNASSGQ